MILPLILVSAAFASEPAPPVKTLAAMIVKQKQAAQEDVAARIADHVWAGGYLAPAARKDMEFKNLVADSARAWVKARVEAGQADAVARLYYVLGAGEKTPAWAGKISLKGYRTDEWLKRMKPWTEAAPQAKAGPLQPGRLEPKRAADWPAAFLADAAEQAARLAKKPVAVKTDESLEQLGEDLSASREKAPGELRRFKKARELLPPPIPKVHQAVPQPVNKVTDPILKPVDKVTETVTKPLEPK
jgi:hypothetical protein